MNMRWKLSVGALALLLAAVGGCKQRCFVTSDDFRDVENRVPMDLPVLDVMAKPTIPLSSPPGSLYDLDRKIRYFSLAEAVAIALEQGNVGQPSLLFPGISLDNLVQFTGNGVTGDDSIRVLSLDPATVGAGIEASMSKFDAVLTSSMTWNSTDQPIATPTQVFQTGSSGVTAIVETDAQLSTGIIKPLPTGGTAGLTLNVPYQFTNLPAAVNPNYRPQLLAQFEQPLLQGFGVEINQLRAAHPGSLLNPGVFNTAPTPNGILITRLRFDQQRAEFERNVIQMLLNVETAYWNLYGSYWNLYSRGQAQRFAFEAWRIVKAQFDAGSKNVGELGQARGQYELFRAQRLAAIDTVLDNERQLRGLLGMPVDDGTRLMPSDQPTLARYRPDWNTALIEALHKRPEIFMARMDVKANQMNLILAKNSLLPDLRFIGTYDANAVGSTLQGGGANADNALAQLASNHFNDWQLGLRLNMPIGFRAAHANVRIAKLQLARSFAVLQDQELKAERFLGLQYRRIASYYAQTQAQRAQRIAYGEQLKARFQEFLAERKTLDILLESQRFWADALANEYAAIVGYNNAICAFEFAKGTILQHNNITISEGPLPACAQVRAVEHEAQRTRALVLRERAAPMPGQMPPPPTFLPGVQPQAAAVLEMSPPSGGSLPALFKNGTPMSEPIPSPDSFENTLPPPGSAPSMLIRPGAEQLPRPRTVPGANPAAPPAVSNPLPPKTTGSLAPRMPAAPSLPATSLPSVLSSPVLPHSTSKLMPPVPVPGSSNPNAPGLNRPPAAPAAKSFNLPANVAGNPALSPAYQIPSGSSSTPPSATSGTSLPNLSAGPAAPTVNP
jgi:outer membrane protein TolC